MKNFTPQSNDTSRERRNLGFVKLRRGLKEHLHRSRMSSNASTMFVWLLLSARHSGSTRGSVEANYDDLMRGLGWSSSMVRRTLEELISKGYISVTPAANQHEITVIKILKFDTGEDDSAVLTSEHPKNSAVSTGALRAVFTSEQSTEQSRPYNLQSQRDLQAPKNAVEGIEGKNGKANAVRRPIDAELRIASSKSFSPSERIKKLKTHLEEAISRNGSAFHGEFDDDEREAFAYIRYQVPDTQKLTGGFVYSVWEVYEKYKATKLPLPGILCCKIIDHCMQEQESCKTLGSDPSDYFWPTDFQEHRKRLMAQEQAAKKGEVRR
jgi:hypothetical protein